MDWNMFGRPARNGRNLPAGFLQKDGKFCGVKLQSPLPENCRRILLMDIQMPVMNGYEAALAIRTMERVDAKSIPILALTANAFTSDIAKAQNSGMNDHIAKPIDVAHMLTMLKRWIK